MLYLVRLSMGRVYHTPEGLSSGVYYIRMEQSTADKRKKIRIHGKEYGTEKNRKVITPCGSLTACAKSAKGAANPRHSCRVYHAKAVCDMQTAFAMKFALRRVKCKRACMKYATRMKCTSHIYGEFYFISKIFHAA